MGMSRTDIKNEDEKDFVVGYWYKLVETRRVSEKTTKGSYCKVLCIMGDQLTIEDSSGLVFHDLKYKFDVNSGLTFKPIITVTISRETKPNTNNFNINQQGVNNMNTANRRTLQVSLIDNDKGLSVEYALVWSGVIVTEEDNQNTINSILVTGEIAEAINEHNDCRVEQVNLGVQNRTGLTVNLQPIQLKDLTWEIK